MLDFRMLDIDVAQNAEQILDKLLSGSAVELTEATEANTLILAELSRDTVFYRLNGEDVDFGGDVFRHPRNPAIVCCPGEYAV
jgi:hypothetical protein